MNDYFLFLLTPLIIAILLALSFIILFWSVNVGFKLYLDINKLAKQYIKDKNKDGE